MESLLTNLTWCAVLLTAALIFTCAPPLERVQPQPEDGLFPSHIPTWNPAR
jgi:hypothetical protein